MTRSAPSSLALLFSVLLGCTSEAPPSGQGAGSVSPGAGGLPPIVQSASIIPNPIVLSRPVAVAIEALDPEGSAVSYRHQWYVNGERMEGQTGPTLPPELLSRGDRVSVEVIAIDLDEMQTPYRTTEVVVVNTPPRVTEIRIDPYPARPGDRLVAEVKAEDVDGDEIEYRYQWMRNEKIVADGLEPTLETKGFRRGDEIQLAVIPSDGDTEGEPERTDRLALANRPPEVTSNPPSRITGGKFEYTIAATDPDGDPLVYGLKEAPDGMVIDPQTGQISWQLDSSVEGTFQVVITISDGQDDEPVSQEFNLIIPGQSTQESRVPLPEGSLKVS